MHNKIRSTGVQQNAQQRRQRGVSGFRLEGVHALIDPISKHQCKAGVKHQ